MKAKPKVCSEESFENSGRIFYQTAADEFRTGHCKVWCTRASAKWGWEVGVLALPPKRKFLLFRKKKSRL